MKLAAVSISRTIRLSVSCQLDWSLLKASAEEAVRQWQFDPSQPLPDQIRIVLDFSLHCRN